LAPKILPAVEGALANSLRDLDFIRLDAESFAKAPNISIDYAVMEKTERAVLVPCHIGWNDVGAWSSLWDVRPHDDAGNVLLGDVVLHDVCGSLIMSDRRLTAVVGVEDLVVISTKDAVLIADKNHTQDVKVIVDKLKAAGRSEPTEHSVVYRPWGSYEVIDRGEGYLVNHVMIKPGCSISCHKHDHRAEHWIVVDGTAMAVCGENKVVLHKNQSTFIRPGERHRLENPGRQPLRLVEVQSGPYLGADDIVRGDETRTMPKA